MAKKVKYTLLLVATLALYSVSHVLALGPYNNNFNNFEVMDNVLSYLNWADNLTVYSLWYKNVYSKIGGMWLPSYFKALIVYSYLQSLYNVTAKDKILTWIEAYDPLTGKEYKVPVFNPNKVLEWVKKEEKPFLQKVVEVPIGPEYTAAYYIRPYEVLEVKLKFKNKEKDYVIPLAVPRKPEPRSWWEYVGFTFNEIKDAIVNAFKWVGQKLGLYKPPEIENKTQLVDLVPTYIFVAAIDPQGIRPVTGTTWEIDRPGGAYEVEPGYGCYDIVVANPASLIDIGERMKTGELSINDLFCGEMEKGVQLKFKDGWVTLDFWVKSHYGPIAYSTPLQPSVVIDKTHLVGRTEATYIINRTEGKTYVLIPYACTDQGDGQSVTFEVPTKEGYKKITIDSRAGDCILNPGESMIVRFYLIANPTPSSMVPPEAAAEIITKLTGEIDVETARELMQKYYGAIHELWLFMGGVPDARIGVTLKDIKKSLLSVTAYIPGAGFVYKWLGISATETVPKMETAKSIAPAILLIAAAITVGVASGLYYNYQECGKPLCLPAWEKFSACVFSGECIYRMPHVWHAHLYIVMQSPRFEATVTFTHFGLIALVVALGAYFGRKAAGY